MLGSSRARPLLLALAVAVAGGCGDDPPPVAKVPTAQDMRNFYGLNPGSCWLYKNLSDNSQLTASVSGPDTVRIAGRSVFVVSQVAANSSVPLNEFLLDADATPGKLFLARASSRTGAMPQVVETYLMDPRPLWGELVYENDVLEFAPDNRMESASTPQNGSAAIAHQWTVANREQMVAKDDGTTASAIRLVYSKGGVQTAIYDLVPNYGMAHMQLNGTEYQVCRARVCDAAGACTGADSCANVTCP